MFHYCVEGVKHSWQCPENTVFHQIHLNCVPNTQDICQQSSKYHIVNEYLHKVNRCFDWIYMNSFSLCVPGTGRTWSQQHCSLSSAILPWRIWLLWWWSCGSDLPSTSSSCIAESASSPSATTQPPKPRWRGWWWWTISSTSTIANTISNSVLPESGNQ